MTNIEKLKALVDAGEKATQGEMSYDDEEPTIYSDAGIAWDFEDGWGSVEDRDFFIKATNSREALKALLEKLENPSTGMHDRNGREIFVGDWLDFDEKEWGGKFEIEQVPSLLSFVGDWPLCGSKSDVDQYRAVVEPPKKGIA